MDARLQLAVGVVAHYRPGRPREDRLIDNALGGGEVLLHQERRHAEHVADVVEAVTDVIGWEVVGWLKIDPDEIADSIVVLGAVEAMDGDTARVAAFGAVDD